MHLLLYGLLGIAAGVFSGLFGLGGGAIVIPALVFLFGFSQQSAQGTSLAMFLPPIGLLAVIRYWQAGFINIPVAVVLAATFFIGAAVGAHYAVGLPEVLLKRVFGGVLAIIGIFMIITGR